jgi:hypothetical protein
MESYERQPRLGSPGVAEAAIRVLQLHQGSLNIYTSGPCQAGITFPAPR